MLWTRPRDNALQITARAVLQTNQQVPGIAHLLGQFEAHYLPIFGSHRADIEQFPHSVPCVFYFDQRGRFGIVIGIKQDIIPITARCKKDRRFAGVFTRHFGHVLLDLRRDAQSLSHIDRVRFFHFITRHDLGR